VSDSVLVGTFHKCAVHGSAVLATVYCVCCWKWISIQQRRWNHKT